MESIKSVSYKERVKMLMDIESDMRLYSIQNQYSCPGIGAMTNNLEAEWRYIYESFTPKQKEKFNKSMNR